VEYGLGLNPRAFICTALRLLVKFPRTFEKAACAHTTGAGPRTPNSEKIMRRKHLDFDIAVIISLLAACSARAQDLESSLDARDKVKAQIDSKDAAQMDLAVQQIRLWLASHLVPDELLNSWLPGLLDHGRYQDVAELSLSAVMSQADQNPIEILFELRTQSLLKLDKPQEALQAAKSYYNVCELKLTNKAIDLVAICLAKSYPDDLEIVPKFRSEQNEASRMVTDATSQPETPAANPQILKSVKIDDGMFADALKAWSQKTQEFNDRVSYGNLLLAANHGQDAEKLFRELYKMAATDKELSAAADGLARTLRAEDGNVARASFWLLSLQQTADGNASAKPQ